MVDVEQTSLIEALKRHDRAAWAAAVERHYRDVYGFVYHLTGGDRAVAEDLSQEAWLEAVGGIEHCDASRGSFRNWLLGIARKRVALHYRRRNAKAGTVPFGDGEWGVADWGDGCVLPEEAAEQLERASVVRAAMLVVPDDRRGVLLAKYVEGLSVDEIATRLGKSAKAIESLLSRSREQLRRLLGGYFTTDTAQQQLSEEA